MRHALVTGAGGFIGRSLCEHLSAAGVTVCALHRHPRPGPWSRELLCDLSVAGPRAGDLDGIDTVFHLAGHAHAEDVPGSDALHRRTSVDGTAHLLESLGRLGPNPRRLIYFSSVKAMGESTPPDGVDESATPDPTTAYGRSRLEAEQLVRRARPGLATTVLRLPLVYGAGSRGNLDRLLRAADAGRMPLLPEFHNRRSMIHVRDVCAAALACAGVPADGVFLLSDGVDYSTRQVQELVLEVTGRPLPRWRIPHWSLVAAARAGSGLRALGWRRVPFDSAALARLSQSACYRAGRAREAFGFTPRENLRGGLEEMLGVIRAGAG